MIVLPARYSANLEAIGQGGFGTVYRTRDLQAGYDVAVKVPFKAGEDDLAREVATELQAGAALRHPAIVQVLDAGLTGEGQPFLVMEYAGEGSMNRFLKEAPPSWDLLLPLLDQILDGLGFAHAGHLVHRDVKGDNVLLARDAQGRLAAKLADFGLAKLMQRKGQYESTRMGAGTLLFMPPEQFEKDTSAIHPGADLYAFGVLLYLIVAGRRPWEADNEISLMFSKVTTEPAPLIVRAGYLAPPGLDRVAAHLLAPRPADRYELAADVRRDLRALGRKGPLPAVGRSRSRLGGETSLDGRTVAGIDLPDEPPDDLPLPPFPPTVATSGVRIPRFVGRHGERWALWQAARAAARDAHGVVIAGEAGSGRTRLAEWLFAALEMAGHARTLHVRIEPDGTPGQALTQALRRFLYLGRLEGEDLKRRIEEWLRSRDHQDPADGAMLLRWLGQEGESSGAVLDQGARLALLQRLLRVESDRGFVCAWVEDRAGTGAELAQELLRAGVAGRFPVLVVFEPPAAHSGPDFMPPGFGRIELTALALPDTLDLVTDLLPDPRSAEDIVRLARGLPRVAVETARFEAQRRAPWAVVSPIVEVDEPVWDRAADTEAHTVLPTIGVSQVAGERLAAFLRGAALPDDAVRAVLALVLLPRPCPRADVERAVTEAGGGAPGLGATLDGARAAGLLQADVDGALDFASAPVLDAARVLLDRRPDAARLRWACAQALLERAGRDGVRRARAGRLLLEGGYREEALPELLAAGEALLAHDLEGARRAFDAATEAAVALGLPQSDPGHLGALLGTSRAARNAGDLDAAARAVESVPLEALDPPRRALVLESRASVGLLRGDMGPALAAATEAQRILEQLPETPGYARILLVAGECRRRSGDRSGARQAFTAALSDARARGAAAEEADAWWRIGRIDLVEGRTDDARHSLEAAGNVARRIGDQRVLGNSLRDLGNLDLKIGSLDAAAGRLEESIRILEQGGFRTEGAGTRISLGEVARAQGRFADARKEYSAALSVARAFRLHNTTVVALIDLAAVELAMGQGTRAAWRLREIDELVPPTEPHVYRAYIDAVRMAVHACTGDFPAAEEVLMRLAGPSAKPPQDGDFLFLLELTADAARKSPDPMLMEDAYAFALRMAQGMGDHQAEQRIRAKVLGG